MIQLSLRGKIRYQFLSLIVLLLICYTIGFLLESLYQLPDIPLMPWAARDTIRRFSGQSLNLLLVTGFAAAGLTMLSATPSERVLPWLLRGWKALVAVILLSSPFLPALLTDVVLAIALLALLTISMTALEKGVYLRVWQIGILLVSLCLPAQHLVDGAWQRVISLFQFHVAYGICAVSLVFWQMRGFSTVDPNWSRDGVRIVAALVFLGGSLISLAPLGMAPLISLGATPLILLPYMILAGHLYRALSLRNADASLAPHWIALATLFWLISGGLLGVISVHAGINKAMQNTALEQAQDWLMAWALLAMVLAFVNASASELRGDNRRVTGYVPLWLIGFGVGLSSIVAVCRGVVETYARDVFAAEASSMPALLLPLTQIWIICLLAVGLGIIFYALGFWARRPQIQVMSR